MPVSYNKEKGKWCVGSKCVFDSKEKAERAYQAYLAKKYGGGRRKEARDGIE